MGIGAHDVLVAGALHAIVIVVAVTAGGHDAAETFHALAQVGTAGVVLIAHDGMGGQRRFEHHVVDETVG